VILEREERVEVGPWFRAAELLAGQAIPSGRRGELPEGRSRLRRRHHVMFPSAAAVALEVERSVAPFVGGCATAPRERR
jgi:hypothetical protein